MINFHSESLESVLRKLDASVSGLSQSEAEKRQKKYGLNELPSAKPLSKTKIFLSQFKNALVYILLFAGILSAVLGEVIDASVIFGAVLLNVIIGFRQESKANNAIAKLKTLVERKAIVMRDGRDMVIDSALLTIGDIILINAGNRIPADARLIEAADLHLNESSLTGESLPADKKIEPVPTGATIADRDNMVYAGTVAVRGSGRAVVTGIGSQTEIGKIAEMVKSTQEEATPLQIRLAHFSRTLGLVFAVICLIVIPIGLLEGRGFLEMVQTAVAIGVASIPEGLTVAVTFILALGMQRILKKRALTRKLVAAETLGSTTVICTDKTGTLTEGKMHVDHIVIGEKEFEFDSPGTRQSEKEAAAVSLILQTAMMCNDAIVENPDDALAAWRFIGTPTETALMSAAIQAGLRKEELLKIEPQIEELPFDSAKKYMLSLHQRGKSYVLYEKGAPEILIEKSAFYHHQDKVKKLGKEARDKLKKTYVDLTGRGLRVIGFAIKEFDLGARDRLPEKGSVNWENLDSGLTFIGFIAIKDPLRPEAAETIAQCRDAGIRPVIITGDHALTAKAIALEIGMDLKAENIISGEELDKVSDEKLKKIVKKIDLYARVSPHHKLRIVKALQERGEVVAMTGDGINDSPALKAADIGISLGTGTDIAKETADIVLLNNNFKTIVETVREGRVIFKNIRKVVTYLISDSFSEIILITGTLVFAFATKQSIPLAILPVQILWINIVNDGFPHFSLAYEQDHGTVMKEKPLKKSEPILNKEIKSIVFGAGILRDFVLFGLFLVFWSRMGGESGDIAYLRTLMFAALGVKSLMSIFSLRALHNHIWELNPFANKKLVGAVSASFCFLLAGIYWPPLQSVLQTVSLDAAAWGIAVLVGLLSIVLIELVKSKYIFKAVKTNV